MQLIINHKANLMYKEIANYEKKIRNLNIIIMPSLCYLSIFKKGRYILGSQDISEFNETNRTGEINLEQLKSLNVKYALIGHHDRRMFNKESESTISKKLEKCLQSDITPIYCVGHEDFDKTKEEIKRILENYKKEMIIAYEPKENIGNEDIDLNKTILELNELKSLISEHSTEIKLVYGGGVSLKIIKELKNIEGLFGILISSESLDYKKLINIYKEVK